MIKCYCGSQLEFENCCKPYISGTKHAPTAEALMRSRYSAFATHNADYLVATTHFSTRKHHKREDILEWATSNQWIKLLVLNSSINSVTFKAFYINNQLQSEIHHEHSIFKLENGKWYYVDGTFF
ncbi:YchJ family protein [Flavobacterium granuli]|uniref:SEC-C motif-containing protein n=1 Tax=Flavobacterium granuli TaxID=280093 RepID=A0A1M5Q1C5_9FLAO|nr:YchJ family metal-binding protein [Flavobacterium granuli]PRZ22030.1 SEC-C motif-containing protein [Flavobacterium granuli]SHH07740.1 SEC-C motif-containing protein [Flavobacterium granuli]